MSSRSTRATRRTLLTVVLATAAYVLLTHQSDVPFMFGYSLFYLLFLLFGAGALAFAAVLFSYFKSRAWYVIAAIAIPVVLSAALIEVFAQVYALRNPAYDVLYVQPDRATGWKGVPNLRFTWAGPYWAAFEFSIPVAFNSAGFRDVERSIEKPAGTVRVALLGDSFVEALQVPFERTAGQVLERSLNARHEPPQYEVLNFGVSAFGLGQYLLTWNEYARAYEPDYVVAYVAGFHMSRTVSRGGMLTQGQVDLWTRPIFTMRGDELVLEPAGQYEQFQVAQQKLIEEQLGGQRMRRRRSGLFLRFLADEMNTRLTRLQRRVNDGAMPASDLGDETVKINLRVLEELAASVRQAGSQLTVADAVRYHGGSVELSETLKRFCAHHGIAYIDVSDGLLRKREEGVSTTRAYDGHFNEVGNEVFAEAMSRHISSLGGPSARQH